MTTIEQDIEKAKKIINGQDKFIQNYGKTDKLHPFTTENIKALLNKSDLHNKKILTTLGSGDQVLDMCLNGANDIIAFDINSLTRYYYNLKKAALLSNINLTEYLEYFCCYNYPQYHQINKFAFNPDTFSKICTFLDKDSYTFWSSLYNEYHPLQIRNGKSLFLASELKHNILVQTINYLNNETNFYKLKEKIKDLNFNFINTDIKELPNVLNEKYDFVYLSSIIQYLDEMYPDVISKDIETLSHKEKSDINNQNQLYKLEMFKQLIIELAKSLNNNGYLIANYIQESLNRKNNAILNKSFDEIFNNNEFSYFNIDAIEKIRRKIFYKEDVNLNDTYLVYTKK